jgi:hypothetical protein
VIHDSRPASLVELFRRGLGERDEKAGQELENLGARPFHLVGGLDVPGERIRMGIRNVQSLIDPKGSFGHRQHRDRSIEKTPHSVHAPPGREQIARQRVPKRRLVVEETDPPHPSLHAQHGCVLKARWGAAPDLDEVSTREVAPGRGVIELSRRGRKAPHRVHAHSLHVERALKRGDTDCAPHPREQVVDPLERVPADHLDVVVREALAQQRFELDVRNFDAFGAALTLPQHHVEERDNLFIRTAANVKLTLLRETMGSRHPNRQPRLPRRVTLGPGSKTAFRTNPPATPRPAAWETCSPSMVRSALRE